MTDPSSPTRAPGDDARDLTLGPLAAFTHDIDVTWFDSRIGRVAILGLAAVIGVVAANVGSETAAVAAVAVAISLGVAVVVLERERWSAQDVVWWYLQDRADRWTRDTGGAGPRGDPAAAEIWLGAHQPGTVPQIYRALASRYTNDARAMARERAAMPDATLEDRVWKAWVVEYDRWSETGVADVDQLEQLVASLSASRDRSMFDTWLALVDSSHRHAARDRAWLAPLSRRHTRGRSTRLPIRRRLGIWLRRFAPVIVFGLSAVVFGSLGATIADRENGPRPEYAQTELYSSVRAQPSDAADVWFALRQLERALPSATRQPGDRLSQAEVDSYDVAGYPSMTWVTHAIEMRGPPDLKGHRIWQVLVFLGGNPGRHGDVVLTIDTATGDHYLYRIDPAVTDAIRNAAGLSASVP